MELTPQLVDRLREVAYARLRGRPPAHDAAHVARVAALSRIIAAEERAQVDVAFVGALLHEHVNLPKDHPDAHRSGDLCAAEVTELLAAEGCDATSIAAIAACIRDHAFSKGVVPATLEARVVQDADRLDAIGAIGIARCFATCTEMMRPLHHPDDPCCRVHAPDDRQWGADHFFRKLLAIPARLNTKTARALAEPRVLVMKAYLAALEDEVRTAR